MMYFFIALLFTSLKQSKKLQPFFYVAELFLIKAKFILMSKANNILKAIFYRKWYFVASMNMKEEL